MWPFSKEPEARSQKPVLLRRGRELTEVQVRAALRVDANNPLWMAVHQLIEQQVEEAKFQVADAETQLRPQLLSFYAGGINVLERLQGFLIAERERALKEEEDD